jgi:hypothetical protein
VCCQIIFSKGDGSLRINWNDAACSTKSGSKENSRIDAYQFVKRFRTWFVYPKQHATRVEQYDDGSDQKNVGA